MAVRHYACKIINYLGKLDKTTKNRKYALICRGYDYIGLQPMFKDEKMAPCQLRDSSGIKKRMPCHLAFQNQIRQNISLFMLCSKPIS